MSTRRRWHRPATPRRAWLRACGAALAVVAIGLAVVASRTGLEPSGAVAAGADDAGATVVRFAAVGDSITNANSADFAGLRVGDDSWVNFATGPEVAFVGGWARGGAQTADMVEHARAVEADVLVIIAGTNDLAHGVSFEATTANLVTIARAVGAPRVVVSAIPPRDDRPASARGFNRELEPFVRAQGWTFVDAMVGLRSDDRYGPGMTTDGLHPSHRAAEILGVALAGAIVG
ncbi:SGNH/GDSL hydrolase family protein [Pengzhenrongella sicca]|uniref:SGNH hydrolase-type esterase domain-containing protein n=1 Tax=Pengzhenrongella sicca TaxID=2819238 RepID=A0A8A4ZHL4_9MICO|nr:GDSL-type esterase/lipase family protein [Pengzhenrongella sicca]QTE30459.1 hypothetical protein J4E96_05605 [Pengzhenrongella sicca]